MKSKIFVMACAFAFSSLTFAETSLLRIPNGMRAASGTIAYATNAKASMQCSFYQMDVVNGKITGSHALGSQSHDPIVIGTPTFWEVSFPAPYEDAHVSFNHTLVAYGESGSENWMPYIQAYFMIKGNPDSDLRDANFDISGAVPGSKLLLRGWYNFNESVSLSYQCSFNFL